MRVAFVDLFLVVGGVPTCGFLTESCFFTFFNPLGQMAAGQLSASDEFIFENNSTS